MNTIVVILIFGGLFLLFFVLITNPLNANKKANFWLGIFSLLFSTFWLDEILKLTKLDFTQDISSFLPVRFFQFLTPVVFYYSTVYFTNPDYRFEKRDLLHLISPFILLIVLLFEQQYPANKTLFTALISLIVLQAIYFITYSYIKIQHHKKSIRLFSSNTVEIDLKWLEHIIYALLALSFFIAGYNIFFSENDLNLFANTFVLFIIFFIAFNALKQKEIFTLNETERIQIIQTKSQTNIERQKVIDDDELIFLKEKLIKIMEKDKPFLDSDLSLISLSKLINLSPHQLSYLINVGFNKNFFLFVNKYRVELVKELLANKSNDNLSILGIAFESGFNSKTAFNTTFKKFTHQTPSEYKKSRSTL
ncbi:helix-turn-helix domain-containing protein [Aquimarina litoralis]|uniref:helix-turn-helix domain-containing protein n=1 Tax=Aquimarina litoralis TaxID=584605 RepID=UPI001C57932D|nr:helix-turn-helix domain-containing protein [Aquimarina litoralis]MBW1298433.1 helix-turn-helix domain-containing protein [Aquimarina litoralis]